MNINDSNICPDENMDAGVNEELSQSLLVEQSFPFKVKQSATNQSAQGQNNTSITLANSTAWKERTRYITSQGNVIKILENGKIEVSCELIGIYSAAPPPVFL